MTWFHRLNSLIRYFLAVQHRAIVRHHTASALERLDDRMLADIGVTRNRIAEYARAAAHWAVPVAPIPTVSGMSVLERLRSRRKRQVAIRELSSLDARLLRDIGIEPGRIDDVVDTMLSQRRDLGAAHPVVQFSDAIQEVLMPARYRPLVPNAPGAYARIGNDVKTNVAWTPDVPVLRTRAANESQFPERRRRASAGM